MHVSLSYISCPNNESSDFFGMNCGTVAKQNKKGIFCHLLHFIGRKFDIFVKMERIHQNFCDFSLPIWSGLSSSNNNEVHLFHSVKAENYTDHTNK
jgi:hypothetical protein